MVKWQPTFDWNSRIEETLEFCQPLLNILSLSSGFESLVKRHLETSREIHENHRMGRVRGKTTCSIVTRHCVPDDQNELDPAGIESVAEPSVRRVPIGLTVPDRSCRRGEHGRRQAHPRRENSLAQQKPTKWLRVRPQIDPHLSSRPTPPMNCRLEEDSHREVNQLIGLDLGIQGSRVNLYLAIGLIGSLLYQHVMKRKRSIKPGEERQNPCFTFLIENIFAGVAEQIILDLSVALNDDVWRNRDGMPAWWRTKRT